MSKWEAFIWEVAGYAGKQRDKAREERDDAIKQRNAAQAEVRRLSDLLESLAK